MEDASERTPSASSVVLAASSSTGRGGSSPRWIVHICPATGGNFDVHVSANDRVDTLKSVIGQRLKIPKERINLLYRDRLLCGGRLVESGVTEGSRITLLPSVHAGLVSQKSEHPVVQALENLTEGQVNDFICGKSPLTLAMRLGDHMMFVQLQLSTAPPRNRTTLSSTGLPPHMRPSAPSTSQKHFSTSSTCSSPASSPEASPSSPLTPIPPSIIASSSPSTTPPQRPRFTFPPTAATPEPLMEETRALPLRHAPHNRRHAAVPASAPAPARLFDSATLADAKRSLSMKLREFSHSSDDHLHQESCRKSPPPTPPSGAIIESMEHLGGGVYSGTFSGTLNPRLQEVDGKPRRSVNTIVHILNDLLGASPQYSQLRLGCKRPATAAASSHLDDLTCRSTPQKQPRMSDSDRLSEENNVTRSKVERLQKMLEMRRRSRRVKETRSGEAAYVDAAREQSHVTDADLRASDPKAEHGAVVS